MTDKHSTDKDKEIENINPKPEWEQIEVVHCPDISCSGMLLQSRFYYTEKCSDCGKYWKMVSEFEECEGFR